MTIFMIDPGKMPDWPADHVRRYLATDGAEGYWADFSAVGGPAKAPNLILTVVGRQSGRTYRHGLIYGETRGCYVIIGSKGGAPDHPAWYLNLLANLVVEVQIKERKFRATARVASGEERAELWKMMVDLYGGYADVQGNTAREFPIVVLDPLAG